MLEIEQKTDHYLMLLGKNPSGSFDKYFPDSDTAQLMPKETHRFMDQSLILDDEVGKELFVLFFSPKPFRVEDILPTMMGKAIQPTDLVDVESVQVEFLKVGQPAP